MEIFSTIEGKIAHLKAIAIISICDNKIDERERQHLISLQKLYGVPEDVFNIKNIKPRSTEDIRELNEVLQNITISKHKLALIQDLISCAYCDGYYSDIEKKKLREISAILEISEEKIIEIEDLNEELLNLQKKLAIALKFEE